MKIIYSPAQAHRCDLESPYKHPAGTVVMCEGCGKYYANVSTFDPRETTDLQAWEARTWR